MLTSQLCIFFLAGSHLTAQIFTPTTAPNQNWVSLASSADGTYLASVGSSGYLYLSADSGASWMLAATTLKDPEPEQPWEAVAMSANGSTVVAVADFSPIFISTNYGRTWRSSGPAAEWRRWPSPPTAPNWSPWITTWAASTRRPMPAGAGN